MSDFTLVTKKNKRNSRYGNNTISHFKKASNTITIPISDTTQGIEIELKRDLIAYDCLSLFSLFSLLFSLLFYLLCSVL